MTKTIILEPLLLMYIERDLIQYHSIFLDWFTLYVEYKLELSSYFWAFTEGKVNIPLFIITNKSVR